MNEKVLNQEERIRRAEEIYYRRRNANNHNLESATLNLGEKKEYRLFKKMTIQIFACLLIYLAFYAIQNSNYIFSEQVLNKTREVLSYDIDLNALKETMLGYINNLKNMNANVPVAEENTVENITKNEVLAESIVIENTIEESTIVEENEDALYKEEASSISQVEEDANFIKSTYSFIKPLNGKITSRFGSRNPTTPSVPKYHTGIDISANTGTKIIAAMEGKVTQVSSVGDYGKHLRIVNGEITTLYAHCNKIYVKEGDTVKQGQEIAEVGATGNVTGAHLHFEIRRNNEFVDPDSVIEFD